MAAISTSRGYRAVLRSPLSHEECSAVTLLGRKLQSCVVIKVDDTYEMVVCSRVVVFTELNDRVDERIQAGIRMLEDALHRTFHYHVELSYCRRVYTHSFTKKDIQKLSLAFRGRHHITVRIPLRCFRGRCVILRHKMVVYCTCDEEAVRAHMNILMMNIGRVLGGGD